jgi:hypothetical protein
MRNCPSQLDRVMDKVPKPPLFPLLQDFYIEYSAIRIFNFIVLSSSGK